MNETTPPQPMHPGGHGEPARLGEYNSFEVYPMPMFATIAAEAPADIAAWYERTLGFATMFAGPVIHLRRSKYQDLLIAPSPAPTEGSSTSLALSFMVDGVDALAERAYAAEPLGKSSVEGPVNTPWNTRDLRVTDPLGNRLVFTSRREDPDPEVARRWQEAFEAGRR